MPPSAARPGFAISLARWLLFWLVAIPWTALVCLSRLFGRRPAAALFHPFCRTGQRLLGITSTRSIAPAAAPIKPGGRYVFVQLNQASLVEFLVFAPAIPVPYRAILNLEFALLPFLGWAAWAAGGIVVVRQWQRQSRRALSVAESHLFANGSVVISIEGRRSEDGSLSRYKKGPVLMAITTSAGLVPVTFHGARERLPVGEWRVRPGAVHLVFHAPIPTLGRSYADRDALVADLRALAERELSARGG
jgi:1-acyl-sn-glycerol-3-phosphate acyltransferase